MLRTDFDACRILKRLFHEERSPCEDSISGQQFLYVTGSLGNFGIAVVGLLVSPDSCSVAFNNLVWGFKLKLGGFGKL